MLYHQKMQQSFTGRDDKMSKQIYKCRAPLRIDLAGGTLDIPAVAGSMKGGGVTLNAGISMYAYSSVYPSRSNDITIESLDYGTSVHIKYLKKVRHNNKLDLLKDIVKGVGVRKHVKILTRVDSPPQSRLGTSSALAVSLIGALKFFKGKRIRPTKIADLANAIEAGDFHMCQGKQDQYGSALGGINFLKFKKAGKKVIVDKIKPKNDIILELERNMFLCYIGKSVVSGDLNQKMIDNYLGGDRTVVRSFNNIRDVTIDMVKSLKKGDLTSFVKLLNAERINRSKLDPLIVDPKSQKFVNQGLKKGALAAKILGAGGGGCILFYSKEDKQKEVKNALARIGGKIIDFNFDFDGLQTWKVNM